MKMTCLMKYVLISVYLHGVLLFAVKAFGDAEFYVIDAGVVPSTSSVFTTLKTYGNSGAVNGRDRFHFAYLNSEWWLVQADFTSSQQTFLNGKSWAHYIGKQSGLNVDSSVYDALSSTQYAVACSSCPK